MNKTTAITVFLMVMCALIGIVTGSDGFLTADTTSQITVLGHNATYLITIKNTGNEANTYNLTATNLDDGRVAMLNQSAITLDAGCSGNVALNVTDSEDIGPYCVIVNATSQTNAEVTDEIEIITAVVEEL